MSADGSAVDEDDVALIDALHVHPRASFTQLGAALGVSAVTVGRRWRRLSTTGAAWVSSAPGPSMAIAGAVVEIACVPGRVPEVARALAELPSVFSVHLTTGAADLYALVITGDAAGLARLLVERIGEGIGATGAVRRIRTGQLTAVFSGPHWRLGALSLGAAEALRPGEPHSATAMTATDLDRALFLALQVDGRASHRDLSIRLDRSEPAIRRRIAHLLRTGWLTFRTDFVRPEAGWPAQVALSLRVPDELLGDVGRRLGAWAETRVCAAVVDTANLFVTVQLHDLTTLDPLLRRIRAVWPGVEIADRRVVLRPVKSWGRILDNDGRAVRTVAVDPWSPVPG